MGVLQQQGVVLGPRSARTGLVAHPATPPAVDFWLYRAGGEVQLAAGVMGLDDEGRAVVGLGLLVMMNCRGNQ